MQRAAMEYNIKPSVSRMETSETGLPSKHDRNNIDCLNHSGILMTLQAMMMQLQVTFDPSFCLSSPLQRLWFLWSFQWCRSQRRLIAQQRCNDLSESCQLRMFQLALLKSSIKHALLMWRCIFQPTTFLEEKTSVFFSNSALKQLKNRATLIPFFSCSTLRAGDSGPSLGNSVAKDAIAMMHGQV